MTKDLIAEIKWVMLHYGSDAGERQCPGSKLQAQAERIAEFVEQYRETEAWLRERGYHHIKPTRPTWWDGPTESAEGGTRPCSK